MTYTRTTGPATWGPITVFVINCCHKKAPARVAPSDYVQAKLFQELWAVKLLRSENAICFLYITCDP